MNEEQNSTSFKTLLEQLDLTKKELGDTEENIRRLTGRDPDIFTGEGIQGQPGLNKRRPQQALVSDKSFVGRKRPLFPIVKVKEEDIPQEDSPDEDEVPTKKPSLSSTVVATPKDIKSRKETIQEQNVNSKVKARNRRMFGMILGTLQKFQHDAKKREEKDLKRAEIEQKVEAAAAEEKEKIKKEKEELFQVRREKQAQLRCLEKKIEIAELHEAWENKEKHMVNFIMTKCQPSICFLPATHTPRSVKCLEMSRKKTLERIQERREKMEKELQEVEELYKKSNFPGDKENIGPIEEDGFNELTDTQEQNIHQHLSDTQNTHEEFEEALENQNSHQELQDCPQELSESLNEASITQTENVVSNEHLSSENNENSISEKTDQDFEPIYD